MRRTRLRSIALAVVTALAALGASLQPEFVAQAQEKAPAAAAPDRGRAAAALDGSLGADFGGAWMKEDGTLVVGVTDESRSGEVRAAGAVAQKVERSFAS